jgi:spermidine synthase
MGVGTLAAVAQAGDVFRFYEINPDVYQWSSGQHPYFTYLQNSRGKIEVVLGDARVSLQDEAAHGLHQNFDLLVLDAFSSDAIPMHLLTREAFTIYLQHLRGPRSVIAVHISNNTLDLLPVLAGIAQEFRFHALHVTPFLPNGPLSQSDWVLLSHDPAALDLPSTKQDSQLVLIQGKPILWTDDYCSLLGVLRPRQ